MNRAKLLVPLLSLLLLLGLLSSCTWFGGSTVTSGSTRQPVTPTAAPPAATSVPENTTAVPVTASAVTTQAEITSSAEVPSSGDIPSSGEENPKSSAVSHSPCIAGSTLLGYSGKGYPIEEKDGVTYVGGILIANKSYGLPKNYAPAQFQGVSINYLMVDDAMLALQEMSAAFCQEYPGKKGFRIFSGFRSYSSQYGIYQNWIRTSGVKMAAYYAALPGYSEHQTGLAADICAVGGPAMASNFDTTTEGKWLAENSWKYGFILRYPKDGQASTGYNYESWHFRYLGVDVATEVYASGLSLEDFLGIDSVYPPDAETVPAPTDPPAPQTTESPETTLAPETTAPFEPADPGSSAIASGATNP